MAISPGALDTLPLAGTDHDQHDSGRDGRATRPRRNRMFLRHSRFNVPYLEHALLARIRRRLDENEKSPRYQDAAQDLQNSHVIPLEEPSKLGVILATRDLPRWQPSASSPIAASGVR